MVSSARLLTIATIFSLFAAPLPVLASPPEAKPESANVDWSTGLDPVATASYLRATDRRVMVVGAGEATSVSKDARKAVEKSLRASGHTDLVSDGTSLGKVGDLGDQEIVSKAASPALDAVAIVRVFGEDDGEISLVVTFYALDGSVINAFNLPAGDALAPASNSGTGAGVSEKAIGSISDVMENNESEVGANGLTAAEQEYLDKFLHYRYLVTFNVYTGEGAASQTTTVLAGKDNEPVADRDLYHYVGQPELGDRYRKRRALKQGLIIPGLILTSVGIVSGTLLIVLPLADPCTGSYPIIKSCETGKDMVTGGGIALGFGIAGLGMLITGGVLPSFLDKTTKAKVVEDYNRSLRERLELPENVEDVLRKKLAVAVPKPTHSDRVVASLKASPAVTLTGAGLVIGGQF